MLQNLSQHVPQLEKLLINIENIVQNETLYSDSPNVYDVDLSLICAYFHYWWQFGSEGNNKLKYQKKIVVGNSYLIIFLVLSLQKLTVNI